MVEYIEKKKVINVLTAAGVADSDKRRRTWARAICKVDGIPAADVAPVVHGTWLESISMEPEFGGGFMPRRTYFCSECGLREKRKWPYCHCGAKMDGGEKDAQVPT